MYNILRNALLLGCFVFQFQFPTTFIAIQMKHKQILSLTPSHCECGQWKELDIRRYKIVSTHSKCVYFLVFQSFIISLATFLTLYPALYTLRMYIYITYSYYQCCITTPLNYSYKSHLLLIQQLNY